MADAYVAAGSNIRPRSSLARALAMLAREFPGLRASHAYANAAVGFEGEDFVNLVAAFPVTLPPDRLLERLKAIERACGREEAASKWGPRMLDLDLLLYGDLVGDFGTAKLPHPDIETRAWVLGPLAEIAPGAAHPVLGRTFGEMWRGFDRGAHPLWPVALEGGTE